jgi:spermidine/putrescine transport system substrate-binding protein
MKRWILFLTLLLPILSACGGSTASAPTSAPAAPATTADSSGGATASGDTVDKSKLAKELFFYNWSDYIDPAILTDFEKEYGVKVTMDTYTSNEDMIAKVRAGNSGYDIVVPSDYAVTTMATEGLIISLDKGMLSNLSHIDPTLLDQYFDKGNAYSVPYMYGISGIAYNKKDFPNGVDSWSALFDPAQAAKYKGKFSMLDDQREAPGAALKYLGKSLNDTDATDLKAAEDLLIAQKPFLASYNSSDVNRKLASGEYVIAHAWSGMAMQAHNGLGSDFSGNPDITFAMPKEGGMIWMDNMAILKDSPNAYTAHVFLNFLMRPEIAARNAEYIGYLLPNKDGVALLPQSIKDLYAAGFAPNPEMMKRLEWAVRNEKTDAFNDLWTVVKGE